MPEKDIRPSEIHQLNIHSTVGENISVNKKMFTGKFVNITFRGKFQGRFLASVVTTSRGRLVIDLEKFKLKPNEKKTLVGLVAEELKRSLLGSKSLVPNAGLYPYGLLRNRGPNGETWEPLAKSTLRMRKAKAKTGMNDPITGERRENSSFRGQSFKLRETSDHLFHGLTIISAGERVARVGWKGKVRGTNLSIDRLASMQDKGYTMEGVNISKTRTGRTRRSGSGKIIKVPARPFIGIQKKFYENTEGLIKLFIDAKLSGKPVRGNVISTRARIRLT